MALAEDKFPIPGKEPKEDQRRQTNKSSDILSRIIDPWHHPIPEQIEEMETYCLVPNCHW